MANPEHLDRLLQGVEAWNRWREESPQIEPDLSFADLNGTNLSFANLINVDLTAAKLISTNLISAELISAGLSGANLSHANLSHANLLTANLGGADLSCANLSYANLYKTNFKGANCIYVDLRGTDFGFADLSYANFSHANLSHANLSSSNLSSADFSIAILSDVNLRFVQALSTRFNKANLTRACIEDWHINSHTNLQGVVCEDIFTRYDYEKEHFTDRLPHDPNQIFAPGEFTKRYQIVLETVDLFFNDGIDWRAFLDSLQDLKTQYGNDLNIQGIEKKAGGSFLVRLEVPSDADKGTIERAAKELYETKLQILEAKYHAELQAKEREIEIYKQQSADILELAKLAASRPITVEAKAVAENQSSSESYSNTFNNSPIGNFANKMQDQASQQTNQYIGANLNEITTLIHSLRNIAESFPEAQHTEAIEHLEDLETDLKQPPEKRKISRIKAALLTLVGIATAISGTVASTNEFVGQVQELSDKLGIPLPIEQVQPTLQPEAIDVEIEATEPERS